MGFGNRVRTAGAGGFVLLALSACSVFSGSDAEVASASSASASASASGAVAAVASASPGATAPTLPVLASRTGTKDGPIQVDINAVTVEAKFTRVTFTLWNKNEPGGESWATFELLSDGIYQVSGSADSTRQDAWTVDGVYLLDTVNAKRYLPARTKDGACVCSNNLDGRLEPQQGAALWTLFQPLPAGVDTIDISVPKVGLFEKVPVSR